MRPRRSPLNEGWSGLLDSGLWPPGRLGAIQMGNEYQALSIDFFPDGGSAPFLNPGEGLGWFWPYHALRAPEGLYFFLLQIERADIPAPFGFRLVSNWLGHVRNPEDSPQRWIISRRKIPWGNAQRQFGSFVLVREGYCSLSLPRISSITFPCSRQMDRRMVSMCQGPAM